MTTSAQWGNLIGSTAVDSDGDKIGKVGQVYLNDRHRAAGMGRPSALAYSAPGKASPRCTTPSPATENYGSS